MIKNTIKKILIFIVILFTTFTFEGCSYICPKPEKEYVNKYIYIDQCKTLPFSATALILEPLPVVPSGTSEREVATYITDLWLYSNTCKSKIEEIKTATKDLNTSSEVK